MAESAVCVFLDTRNSVNKPTVKIAPLDRIAFEPFGEVIEVNENVRHFTINYGYTERYHDLAKIDTMANNGRTAVSVFRTKPLPWPIQITLMERHPLSSQAFIPLGQQPYLVVVAESGEFDTSTMKFFLANADQGVNYRAGTWHHFCLALNADSDFLVIDRVGDGDNCDEVELSEPLIIESSSLEALL